MKVALKVYRWIIISLVAQLLIMIYFNNFFLGGNSADKLKVKDVDKKPVQVKDISVKVPENAANIKVSSDASYIMYTNGNDLEIMDVKNKKKVKTIKDSKGTGITYYNWINGKNMVVYALGMDSNSSPLLEVRTYDADNDTERTYGENTNNVDDKITSVPSGSKIVDIKMSAQTNTTYVKVKTGESKAKLYKYATMGVLKVVGTYNLDTNFRMTFLEDNLIYKNDSGKLAVRTGDSGNVNTLPVGNEFSLIDVDNDDNIYVAELNEEGKATSVTYGKHEEVPKDAWKKLSMSTPTEPGNILLNPNGNVYILKSDQNMLYNIKSQGSIQYSGKFIQVIDDYVITQNGNEVSFTSINK